MQVQRPEKSHLKYQVPEGWDVVDLGQVFSLEYGLGLTESKREPGKYPVFGSNGIIGYHNRPLACGPGIIVGRKGSIGQTAWTESDFWPIDTTYYINLKKPATSMKWLYYLLSYIRLESLNTATSIPGLNRNEVYSLKYAIPTQQEQHKIAYILSKVDELIQKTDEVIKQTQTLKKGLMQKLFTKGIGHSKFKNSVLGFIPQSWEIATLGDIATISTGGTPPTLIKEYYEGDIPFIRTAEIINKVIRKAAVYVSKKAVDTCSLQIYPPKTIFLAMYGQGKTRGQSALLDIHATTTQNTAAIIADEAKLNAMYLWNYLLYSYNVLRGTGNIGHISHLNLSFVKKFDIPLPDLNEQKRITLILSQIDHVIENGIKIKEKIQEVKTGLMQKLLTGKIRVKA